MRKALISLAAAGTALAFATPAVAQYYPQQPYGYGGQQYGYGGQQYGYGYGNGYDQVGALHARIDRIERQIDQLDRRDAIRARTADRLRDDARNIERSLYRHARNGLNPYEVNAIQNHIARLEQQVQYALATRGGRYGGYNGYNGYDNDRDRDWDHDRN